MNREESFKLLKENEALTRVDFPESVGQSYAEKIVDDYKGYVCGLFTLSGKKIWVVYLNLNGFKDLEETKKVLLKEGATIVCL